MNKVWSLLFLAVPVFGVATFVAAPYFNHWLPRDVSEHGRMIDHLFMFILWLTGFVFVGTEVAIFWFMWRYNDRVNREPARFMHGSHSLELVWTILPAAILLFIAIYQMDAWAGSKMRRPDIAPTAEVTGRQFEWRLRYPGPDGVLDTADDIHHVNDLHLPVGEEVLLVVKSEDVLHSFFLPNLRIKQDVVPGMKQYVWFKANETGQFDIVCAELCGWGHYKMKGQVTLESREEFDAWLAQQYEQEQATLEQTTTDEG
ncbi:MAG: cytochrome c oxidase subunit II [Pirellulales bacterium]